MLLARDTRFNAFKTNKSQFSSRNMFSEILTCLSNVKHKTWKGTITQTCVASEHPVYKTQKLASLANHSYPGGSLPPPSLDH